MTVHKKDNFICYKNFRDKMKWWDAHTKKLKYCSSTKFDEHNNIFGI